MVITSGTRDRDDERQRARRCAGACEPTRFARSRSGIGLLRGANENDASSSRSAFREISHVVISTTTNSNPSNIPAWVGVLYLTTASTTPIATPAASARGNDTMRAISAAASTRPNVSGPIAVRPTALPDVPASRIRVTAESSPPMVHTSVESRFGLIADKRARSGLAAAARTALPMSVRVRNHVSASVMSGTAISTESSAP